MTSIPEFHLVDGTVVAINPRRFLAIRRDTANAKHTCIQMNIPDLHFVVDTSFHEVRKILEDAQ